MKCGNPGSTGVDHTWVEGMRACRGALSVKTQARVMLHHGETQMQRNATYALNDTGPHERNGIQTHVDYSTDATATDDDVIADADAKDCAGCDSLATICLCISFLLVVLPIFVRS